MKKWLQFTMMLIFATIFLSGCLYPEEEKVENQVPDDAQLTSVQQAVEAFKKDTGVLPIKNSEEDTDIFIKYRIDFEKLVPKYLANIPGNAYEKGGIFQYVIWDAEKNPTVKLVDLRSVDAIRDLNIRFLSTKYPTYKEQIADYIYSINFKKIGYNKEITVPSPYTNNNLPLVVTTEGKIYVDYSIDLNIFLKENNLKPTPGEDIRYLLIDQYPVLPAYSLPYTVNEKNEPVFMFKPTKEKK